MKPLSLTCSFHSAHISLLTIPAGPQNPSELRRKKEWEQISGKKQKHFIWGGSENHFVIYHRQPGHWLKVEMSVAQSCPTLCDPVDCSPPGSSVRGTLRASVLEWVAMPFSSPPQGLNLGLLHCRQILYCLHHKGSWSGQAERNRPDCAWWSMSVLQGTHLLWGGQSSQQWMVTGKRKMSFCLTTKNRQAESWDSYATDEVVCWPTLYERC